MKYHIVKIGGNLLDSPSEYPRFCQAFVDLEGPKILVHGGGKRGSRMLERLGIKAQYHQGRRITDHETLEIITMVYSGNINTQLTADLQALGLQVTGMNGCDLNIISAHKRKVKDIDYGFAGDIDHVNIDILTLLCREKITPIISPITHNGKGQLLNTNADTIATTVATNLAKNHEVELHFCFELEGVMKDIHDPTSVIGQLNKKNYQEYVTKGIIADGMIPKLDNAFDACAKGVSLVTIGSSTHFKDGQKGTKISL